MSQSVGEHSNKLWHIMRNYVAIKKNKLEMHLLVIFCFRLSNYIVNSWKTGNLSLPSLISSTAQWELKYLMIDLIAQWLHFFKKNEISKL